MVTMVPQQLEEFTINSYQVLEVESMAALGRRVQNSLKRWKVRLLCPQRPKPSGFSPLQLYAPINLEGDTSDSEEMEYSLPSDNFEYDSDTEGEMDIEVESNSSVESFDMETGHSTSEQTTNYSAHLNHGQAVLRQYAEYLMAEQYDVTPVMLRNAAKGMRVLEKLDVEVNYQHYRFCSTFWKGNLGLSEPAATFCATAGSEESSEDWGEAERTHDSEDDEEESDMEDRPVSSFRMDRKGKGKAMESTGLDVKGKGKKVEVEESQEEQGREKTGVDLMGHQGRAVRLKTEIGYWNNSCCGKSCMGWIRTQQN